jgi:hypothetical protein
MQNEKLKSLWKNKKTISLTVVQTRKLAKGRAVSVLSEGQFYVINPCKVPAALRKFSKRDLIRYAGLMK